MPKRRTSKSFLGRNDFDLLSLLERVPPCQHNRVTVIQARDDFDFVTAAQAECDRLSLDLTRFDTAAVRLLSLADDRRDRQGEHIVALLQQNRSYRVHPRTQQSVRIGNV